MIQDIENGVINLVITKDLSRLGRNYSEAGYYTDTYFPNNNVRYIALNDGIDTITENDITPFKHILNEMYAKDISRKTRSAKKTLAQQGKFINSRAPYGYMKSPEDKHKLIIDENVSNIVVRIFTMFLHGSSGRFIADTFNRENIKTPNDYYYTTVNKPNPYIKHKNKWGRGTVMNIIKNPVYYGAMAQGKRSVKSFKNKQISKNPVDIWIVVEDTHIPIIEKSVWEEAQSRMTKNHVGIRRNKDGDVSLFSGIVVCADCGTKMTFDCRHYQTYIKEYYRCGRYKNRGSNACNPHTILLDTLSKAVIADLKQYAKLAQNDESKLIERLLKTHNSTKQKDIHRFEVQIKEKEYRVKEIDNLIQSLFEEKVSGIVPENIFKRMAKKYDDEQTRIFKELEELQKNLSACRETDKDISSWIAKIKKCLSLETLSREIVLELIERIEVSEVYERDGGEQQDINITYKFENTFSEKEKRAS